MPTPAGWVTSEKRADRTNNHTTLSPSGEDKWALDVALKGTVYEAATDQAEAGSTTLVINATGHSARPKDLIRFTSGAAINYEAYVYEVTANTITLWNEIPVAPAASDDFSILRSVTLTLGQDGSFSGPVKFVRDGVIEDVTEDTVTPANNLPLPVKLTSVTGDINITANDLNVQLSHSAATPDSTQIGDGTEIMLINASGEAQVADDTARASLASIDADTTTIAGDTTSLDTKFDVNLSTRATEATLALAEAHLGNIDTATASIDTDFDVALSTRASEATLVLAEAHLGNIDAATASVDTSIDVALSTRASEVTAAAILADTASIDTNMALTTTAVQSIDTNINVDLSTRASEATLSTVAGDTTSLDAKIPAQGAALTAASLPVNIASDQVVPVSATSLPLPTGAATEVTLAAILADTANIDTNIGTIAGWDTNSGAVGANTQRVHLTDESLAALETINAVITPLDVVATSFTDASSSNIPGNASLPLQILGASPAIKKIQVMDTTGQYLEIMTGAASSEVRVAIVGPGSDQTLELDIPAATRVSVRRLDGATAITDGILAINYIG